MDAAAVLQRSPPLAPNQVGAGVIGVVRNDLDQLDQVPPPVPEVVLVRQRPGLLGEHVAHGDEPLILPIKALLDGVLVAPAPAVRRAEGVKVAVLPTDGDLDDLVQLREAQVGRDLDEPPDLGVAAHDADPDAVRRRMLERRHPPILPGRTRQAAERKARLHLR